MASPLPILREERQLLGSLIELMKQEQACLTAADSDALSLLTPQKSALIARLGQLSAQRHAELALAGCAASEAGMAAWMASCVEPGANALWQEILELTRAAKELNRVNGMLINKHMVNNQVQINAMRTPADGGDAAVYGPSGQASVGGPSRRFVLG